jgi:hypothetical protein
VTALSGGDLQFTGFGRDCESWYRESSLFLQPALQTFSALHQAVERGAGAPEGTVGRSDDAAASCV